MDEKLPLGVTELMNSPRNVSIVSASGVPMESGSTLPAGHDVEKRFREELIKEEIKAQYKIEIQFGKDRSISDLKSSVGVMLIWESGKRFHGGGDQQMYWCGYPDCEMPISTEYFAHFSVVCPHCNRECFLDKPTKKDHIDDVRMRNIDPRPFEAMPVVIGERLFRLNPTKTAELIEKVWRKLGCNADIYVKYHPSDIRFRTLEMTAKTPDQVQKARTLRGLHIYPLARILKDTNAGADPRLRFRAFITA